MVDFTCIISALLFEASNIVYIVFFVKLRNSLPRGSSDHGGLDVTDIEDQWAFRNKFQTMFLVAGLLNALAWMCLSLPLVQLAWILSQRGTKHLGRHAAIGLLAIFGSLTEWMSRLLWMGSTLAGGYLTKNFNLNQWKDRSSVGSVDGVGWRTVELNHVTDNGIILFVDAFEWLCLALILMLIYLSVRDWRAKCGFSAFSKCWNGFGMFLSLLFLLEFAAELLRFKGLLTFRPLALGYAVLLRLVLMPLWILMLGCQMPRGLAALRIVDSRSQRSAAESASPPILHRGSSAMDSSVANSNAESGEIAMTEISQNGGSTPSSTTMEAAAAANGNDGKEQAPADSAFAIGDIDDDDDIFDAYDDLRLRQTQRNLSSGEI